MTDLPVLISLFCMFLLVLLCLLLELRRSQRLVERLLDQMTQMAALAQFIASDDDPRLRASIAREVVRKWPNVGPPVQEPEEKPKPEGLYVHSPIR